MVETLEISPNSYSGEKVSLLGIPIDRITEKQCVAHIVLEITSGRGGWVVTANVDHLRRLEKIPDYRTLCSAATLITADGMPVLWAGKVKGKPLPERVTGSNLIWSLSEALGNAGRSIYLLGGNPGTADQTAKIFLEKYPGIKIAGIECPPLGFERNDSYVKDLRNKLRNSGADFVFVALGSPKQESIIAKFKNELPKAWWMGVGISFSFVTGDVSRAPVWMQKLGLEWVHRLFQEPKRLARRYLVEDIPFTLELLWRVFYRRIRGRD